jgi:hypothetical protein
MGLFQEPVFAPTFVSGARTTGDIVSGRIKDDYADEIFTYQPNGNGVTLLLVRSGKKKREATQYLYNFLQKDRYVYRDRMAHATPGTAYDADDTSIVVANGSRFRARDVVLVPATMERFLVQSVSTNTLTIEQRGLGDTAQPIADGSEFIIVGNAYPENAASGTELSIQETVVFNYTQTIRTPFAFSGREMNTDMFGGPDMKTEEKWQASTHAQKVENALLWGARDTFNDASSAKPNSTTGGLHYWVRNSNEWDLNGIPFNHRNFVEYLEYGMYYGRGGRHGSKTKWLFGSSAYMTQIESWGHDKVRLVPSNEVLGLKVQKIQTTHGDVMLVDHPLFEGDNRDKAFLIDMNHIRYVYHQGRDTQLRRDIGTPSVDGKTHEILTDCGLEVTLPLAHGFLSGLAA